MKNIGLGQINNTLVSGNAGDKKNLHSGDRNFICFNQFSGDVIFSSLVSFAFFGSFFSAVCFLKVYSDAHWIKRADS